MDDPTINFNAYYYNTYLGELSATTWWTDKYVLPVLDGDVAAVVPEPISSILFITGGATLGFRRFMRKKLT